MKFVPFLSSCGCRPVDAQRSRVVAPVRLQCLFSLENSPVDIFGRLETPLNFIMVLVTDREFHRLSICTLLTPQTSGLYQTLWGLCWLGMYWIMVTFLEGCNSKLHFFFLWNEIAFFFYPHQLIYPSVNTYCLLGSHVLAWVCADGGQLQTRKVSALEIADMGESTADFPPTTPLLSAN